VIFPKDAAVGPVVGELLERGEVVLLMESSDGCAHLREMFARSHFRYLLGGRWTGICLAIIANFSSRIDYPVL